MGRDFIMSSVYIDMIDRVFEDVKTREKLIRAIIDYGCEGIVAKFEGKKEQELFSEIKK